MNCWTVLEIEPTSERKVIKSAYAKLLKRYHPETDPEGFQKLRNAYEQAVQLASWLAEDRVAANEEEEAAAAEVPLFVVETGEAEVLREPIPVASEDPCAIFMEKLTGIWEDDNRRGSLQEWEGLLQDEAYWQLEIRRRLNYQVLRYLQEYYKEARYYLPNDIWRALDEHFFWSQQAKELYDLFPYSFVDYVMERTNPSKDAVESLSEHPKYLLTVLLIIVSAAAFMKGTAKPLQVQALFFSGVMFIGGIFWGGVLNLRFAQTFEKKGLFEWMAPFCKYCSRSNQKRHPILWFFNKRQDCIACGKHFLPHALVTELAMGLVFALSTYTFFTIWWMPFKLIFIFSILLYISLQEHIGEPIPNALVYILAGIGGAINLLTGEVGTQDMLVSAFLGGGFFFLWSMWSKRIQADFPKLVAAMGIVLGGKLLLGTLIVWVLGLLATGISVLNRGQWLNVGQELLTGRRMIFFLGFALLGGVRSFFLCILLWIGLLFLSVGKAGLVNRFRIIPSASILMMAAYLVLLNKNWI